MPPIALQSGICGLMPYSLQRQFNLSDARETTAPPTSLRSRKVEAIKIHHLVPRDHEVAYERLLRVATSVDFRDGSQLGVRAEDEVHPGAGPLEITAPAIAPLEHVLRCGGRLPLGIHVEQIHKVVIGQRSWPIGENAVFRLPGVRIQDTQAANQHCHLGSSQRQHACPLHQQVFRRFLMFAL